MTAATANASGNKCAAKHATWTGVILLGVAGVILGGNYIATDSVRDADKRLRDNELSIARIEVKLDEMTKLMARIDSNMEKHVQSGNTGKP